MKPLLTCILAVAFAAPCFAEATVADLEAKLTQLTSRVAALEAQLAAAKAAPAAAAKPAGPTASREEAMALYTKVDGLVVQGKVDEAKSELSAWDAKYAGSGWTGSLNREIAVVGKDAPTDWAVDHWYQGESDVKLDGKKPTLVVFWEVWCPHCKSEVPKVQKLWEQYQPKGLQVLGVTRITKTATEEGVKAFIGESGAKYPMYKENGTLADYFGVQGIPAAAIVKDGKIVWRGHPMRVTDGLLATLL